MKKIIFCLVSLLFFQVGYAHEAPLIPLSLIAPRKESYSEEEKSCIEEEMKTLDKIIFAEGKKERRYIATAGGIGTMK